MKSLWRRSRSVSRLHYKRLHISKRMIALDNGIEMRVLQHMEAWNDVGMLQLLVKEHFRSLMQPRSPCPKLSIDMPFPNDVYCTLIITPTMRGHVHCGKSSRPDPSWRKEIKVCHALHGCVCVSSAYMCMCICMGMWCVCVCVRVGVYVCLCVCVCVCRCMWCVYLSVLRCCVVFVYV